MNLNRQWLRPQTTRKDSIYFSQKNVLHTIDHPSKSPCLHNDFSTEISLLSHFHELLAGTFIF